LFISTAGADTGRVSSGSFRMTARNSGWNDLTRGSSRVREEEMVESVDRVHPTAPTSGREGADRVIRDTDEPTATLRAREIDVRGSGAGSALTPASSFDPTIRGSDSHAAHA